MELVLLQFLAYLVSLGASLRADAISEARSKRLQQKLAKEGRQLAALQDLRSLRDELKIASDQIAASFEEFMPSERERILCGLLKDGAFQSFIADWLAAWDPQQKADLEETALQLMDTHLQSNGIDDAQYLLDLKNSYFDLIEKAVFSRDELAHWRLSLGMSAAIERIDSLRAETLNQGEQTRDLLSVELANIVHRLAEMARALRDLNRKRDEKYSQDRRKAALDAYRKLALEACDIVDLANLPEGDRNVATRDLALRRLYVPLRVSVESSIGDASSEDTLAKLESRSGAARTADDEQDKPRRVPAGERLGESRRLVVLGDPGAGKTTLLRWIATAYLLRLKKDKSWKDLPDVETLPDEDLLPIYVRCRDLHPDTLAGTFDDVFRRVFRLTQMPVEDAEALQAAIREELTAGRAMLLIDGLDEITSPAARAAFSRQLEQLQLLYDAAPFVVTSRIVGYREMPYRIGRARGNFEHLTVAEFNKEDKNAFAVRWCDLVEPPERCEKARDALIVDIHSNDRIERLTGNPMLLTTMALVKRQVGKLPSQRAELYQEAVKVLLQWRSDVDDPIDQREAFPQLEYIGYEMCRQGVQRLREDEVLAVLEQIRSERPELRRVADHTPGEFLKLLERRTAILIQTGLVKHEGIETPVYEFRHLTFQEYLAGRALAFSRFPGRDKSRTVAGAVAPLAGLTERTRTEVGEDELTVTENWREALRLCVTSCSDDDVDKVLLAILTPLSGERDTARPRAAMALLCLADEPNASDRVAQQILDTFAVLASEPDGSGNLRSIFDAAVMEVATTEWSGPLQDALVAEFCRRSSSLRAHPGGLAAMLGEAAIASDDDVPRWILENLTHLEESDDSRVVQVALVTMELGFERRIQRPSDRDLCCVKLIKMLPRGPAVSHAAAWATAWVVGGVWTDDEPTTNLQSPQLDALHGLLGDSDADPEALEWVALLVGKVRDRGATDCLLARLDDEERVVRSAVCEALGRIGDVGAVDGLLARLDDQSHSVRSSVCEALGRICDVRAVDGLLARLDDQAYVVRRAACMALGRIGDVHAVDGLLAQLDHTDESHRRIALEALVRNLSDEIDSHLISRDIDAVEPWLDPLQPIDENQVTRAAKKLELTEDEVKHRYNVLADKLRGKLKLNWRQ